MLKSTLCLRCRIFKSFLVATMDMVCVTFINVPNREVRPRPKSDCQDPTQLAIHSIPQELEAALN